MDSPVTLSLSAKVTGLDQIAEHFKAAPDQYKTALRRAVSRASQWANRQVLRRYSKVTGVQGKIIKGRVRLSLRADSGLVFIGLDPISVSRLNPRQDAGGVKFDGGHYIEGAFIVKGDSQIAGQVMKRRGESRLPIDKQTLEVQKTAMPEVQAVAAKVEARIIEEFTRQLKLLTRSK